MLCGDNGSGKSTLLNTLAGLLKPLSGEITISASGLSVKPRTQMMYVFQHPDSHFFFDTVAEELAQLGVTDVVTTLTQFGLDDCAERSPHQLSEGQKRRLTLLFPILLKKSLIVLDEPTFWAGCPECRAHHPIDTIVQIRRLRADCDYPRPSAAPSNCRPNLAHSPSAFRSY